MLRFTADLPSNTIPCDVPTVLVVDGALLRGLAGKLGALKAQLNPLTVCTGGHLTLRVVPGPATGPPARADTLLHAGAPLTRYAADTAPHVWLTTKHLVLNVSLVGFASHVNVTQVLQLQPPSVFKEVLEELLAPLDGPPAAGYQVPAVVVLPVYTEEAHGEAVLGHS